MEARTPERSAGRETEPFDAFRLLQFESVLLKRAVVLSKLWLDEPDEPDEPEPASSTPCGNTPMKQVFKITYHTGKICIGKDSFGSARYFGSPNIDVVNEDFATLPKELQMDYTVRKEILWESGTATEEELFSIVISVGTEGRLCRLDASSMFAICLAGRSTTYRRQ